MGTLGEMRIATHRAGGFVDGCEASAANLLESSVGANCHFLVCWVSGPPGGRGRWLFSRHGGRSDADVVLLSVQLTRLGAVLPLQVRVEGGGQRVAHWKDVWVVEGLRRLKFKRLSC